MLRTAALAVCLAGCGRSQGMADQDLSGLVVEARQVDPAIDLERAAKDPGELGRALARRYRVTLGALGPHSIAINTVTSVAEAGKPISELSDHAQVDNGDSSSFHAVYTNSADYGRETTYVGGKLYLRPRYQRWNARAPETPSEPELLRDDYVDAVFATWDLLAPGAELTDAGALDAMGRPARKIEIKRSSEPSQPPSEPLTQRKWRENRSIEAVSGEIVLDAAKGVPLTVKLNGTIGYSRDGRRFAMTISVDSTVSGIGTISPIATPPPAEVVATPERKREVDDRDYLLQGIVPPLRRNPDGTAVPPAPIGPDGQKLLDKPSDAPTPAAAPADAALKPTKPADAAQKPGKTKPQKTGKP